MIDGDAQPPTLLHMMPRDPKCSRPRKRHSPSQVSGDDSFGPQASVSRIFLLPRHPSAMLGVPIGRAEWSALRPLPERTPARPSRRGRRTPRARSAVRQRRPPPVEASDLQLISMARMHARRIGQQLSPNVRKLNLLGSGSIFPRIEPTSVENKDHCSVPGPWWPS